MKALSIQLEGNKVWRMLISTLLLLIAAGILQDYLQAIVLHQGFYWSESLLFKAVWLPFLFTLSWLYFRQLRAWFWVPLLTLSHLLFYALLIYFLSSTTLEHTFGFWDVLRRTLAEDAYKYLLVYTLTVLLFRRLHVPFDYISNLVFQSGKHNVSVPVAEIIYLTADDPYVAIYTGKGKHLINLSLKAMEAQLDPALFIRIHRSAVVAIKAVSEFRSRLNGDYDLMLKDGTELRVSRTYSKQLRQRLSR